MKLYPLEPTSRLAVNIAGISRKLRIEVITTKPNILDAIVIVANGTPDDIAFSIISYHLDGEKAVGIIKPSVTRLSVIDLVPLYISKFRKINRIMILIDQEDQEIDYIFNEAKRRLINKGVSVSCEKEENKLRIYECKIGSKSFRLILVINGLDDVSTKKHTIEDHFLKAAEIFLKLKPEFENSKDAWKSIKESQIKVFKKLKEKFRDDIFPQQIRGCKYLED